MRNKIMTALLIIFVTILFIFNAAHFEIYLELENTNISFLIRLLYVFVMLFTFAYLTINVVFFLEFYRLSRNHKDKNASEILRIELD